MNKTAFTRQIREKASELGIEKIGIVPADRLATEKTRLEEWLGRGFHGEMRWMERDPAKRADPGLLFEGAVSVISAAVNYYTPRQHADDPRKGKVSRYAWGDDYHDVVKEKLLALLEWIRKEAPGVRGKVCVDTAPMMDKAWAVRAGIGWLGKHTNVITKEYGSWVFLGEILLDIDLDYDGAPVEDHCGSCSACIDACPTGAIVEPYLVDSNKCISYATIELRSESLPASIGERLEGWFYGCDICQDVCPWNRFEKETHDQRFRPRAGNVSADLEEILSLSQEEYAERFRRSAMKRTKLAGMKRNALSLTNANAHGAG